MPHEKITNRSDQLTDLGLKFNGQEFVDGDFNVHWTELTCDTDKEFNKKVESIRMEKKRRQR